LNLHRVKKLLKTRFSSPNILIAGCGFGGVALGITLKKAGIDSFKIFERAADVGGVWRENTYPGAACDVPSRFYSFSFEQEYPWSLRYAPQNEIYSYLKYCIRKYNLTPHIFFGVTISSAKFNEKNSLWSLYATGGCEYNANIFVSAVGLFNQPVIPEIPGKELFKGPQFHSSRWDHSYDVTGKTIASIGTGASAIQYVPEISRTAKQIYVFQRTPQHIFPKGDRKNSVFEPIDKPWRKLIGRYERLKMFLTFEKNSRRRNSDRLVQKSAKNFQNYIEKLVKSPDLLSKIIPNYPPGCKRGLRSDEWYQTLMKPDVELVNNEIREITKSAVKTADGTKRPVDAIVYGTGFKPTDFLAPMTIQGLNGKNLNNEWKNGAEAYFGMSVAGFPNLFIMYGPNTNLSGSILYMLESQARYITRCIHLLRKSDAQFMTVRDEKQKQFNAELQKRIAKSVLVHENCNSYFRTETGRITTQWPGLMLEYRWRTRRVRKRDYIFS